MPTETRGSSIRSDVDSTVELTHRRLTRICWRLHTVLGRDEISVGDGISVGLYSVERSLVDVIRLRHREGSDVAWDALRRWLRLRGSKPASLLTMAKHFHGAETAVRNVLEFVL